MSKDRPAFEPRKKTTKQVSEPQNGFVERERIIDEDDVSEAEKLRLERERFEFEKQKFEFEQSQRGGQSVPAAQEVVSERTVERTSTKRSWLPLVLGVLGLLAILMVIAYFIVLIVNVVGDRGETGPSPKPAPDVVETQNPASYFIDSYRRGLSALYADAAQEARSGAFTDVKAANEYVLPKTKEIRSKSFVEMAKQLETINGENWSNEKAARVFETFSEGLR